MWRYLPNRPPFFLPLACFSNFSRAFCSFSRCFLSRSMAAFKSFTFFLRRSRSLLLVTPNACKHTQIAIRQQSEKPKSALLSRIMGSIVAKRKKYPLIYFGADTLQNQGNPCTTDANWNLYNIQLMHNQYTTIQRHIILSLFSFWYLITIKVLVTLLCIVYRIFYNIFHMLEIL